MGSSRARSSQGVRSGRRKKRPRQLDLVFRTWGGARPRAGRRPKGAKPGVSHLRRASLPAQTPVHVTLRVRDGLPTLRRRGLFLRERRLTRTSRSTDPQDGSLTRAVELCEQLRSRHRILDVWRGELRDHAAMLSKRRFGDSLRADGIWTVFDQTADGLRS